MQKIDMHSFVEKFNPNFSKYPKFIRTLFLNILGKILHLNEIDRFLEKNIDNYNIQFIDEIFEHINFSFRISNKDITRIPSEGRLIVIGNHPIGSLDSLALIKTVSEIRSDVKIVANDILYYINNIHDLLLPVKLDSKLPQRDNLIQIGKALEKEEAVIMFPAGEVSRLKGLKVVDGKWSKGAVYFAKKHGSPILPMYIEAKNSSLFYFISAIYKPLSTLLLVNELFNKRNKTITISIGDPIPAKVFANSFINYKTQVKLLKKHTYALSKNKKGIYLTEENIIHPISPKLINKELNNAKVLGFTNDNKKILLTDFKNCPYVLRELSRLREITFRKVGEGTGSKFDFDKFDKYYDHIVVWDETELELVGSYRIGNGRKITEEFGVNGFYTSTLFTYSDDFTNNYLNNSIELGRSFIQKKYWNTNALLYLWQGIGAYLSEYPETKYLFGGVSISNNYPEKTKQLLIYYFNKWFGTEKIIVQSKFKFEIPETAIREFELIFTGKNYKEDYKTLKVLLKQFGFSIPTLYKHYSELCEDGGTKFLDFGTDTDFENCIDGFILVEIDKIKPEKKERFINCHLKQESALV